MITITGRAKTRTGFTIIEVMIVLAVSGMMFLLAVVFINGKQDKVAYQQAIQAAGSTVTGVINSVANGEFPDSNSFSCTATPTAPSFGPVANDQGTNGGQNGCIFLGKVLQFGPAAGATAYQTYTVAARQFKVGSLDPVQTFADAYPRLVTSLNQTGNLEQGLEFKNSFLCQGSCSGVGSNTQTAIGAIGLFGSFGSLTSGGASVAASGAQDVTVAALLLGDVTIDLSNTGNIRPLSSGEYIAVCYDFGNKPGSVIIGGQGGQTTSVSVNLHAEAPCS